MSHIAEVARTGGLSLPMSIDLEAAGSEILRAAVGKRVVGLDRDQLHVEGEADSTDAGSVELRFADGSIVALGLAGDGESVHAQAKPIEIHEPFVLGGRFGDVLCRTERVDLLEDPRISAIRNAELRLAEAVVDRYKENPCYQTLVGWALHFDTGDRIVYLNNGDEALLLINEDLPSFEQHDISLEPLPDCAI